jgi:hypothetical protein
MRQYRAETRKPANGTADLSWDIGAGYVRTAKGSVQDESPSGMALVVAMPFSVESTLQITTGSKTRAAIVRRCIRQGANHLLGVQFKR